MLSQKVQILINILWCAKEANDWRGEKSCQKQSFDEAKRNSLILHFINFTLNFASC